MDNSLHNGKNFGKKCMHFFRQYLANRNTWKLETKWTRPEIRDLTANLLTEVCTDVCIELDLQPLTGEALSGVSSNEQDGARLDIAVNGFWRGRYERTAPT